MRVGTRLLKILIIVTFVVSLRMEVRSGVRSGLEIGDVCLQGPLEQVFQGVLSNHVAAQDPSEFTHCFQERTETVFWQSEFWGKYMLSAVPCARYMSSATVKARIDDGVRQVLAAQLPDGYIGNYAEGKRCNLNWDVWGIRYTMMGLLTQYASEKDEMVLKSCQRLCDYLIAQVGPQSARTIAHTGNMKGLPSCTALEPVIWLYRITKDQKYREFADFIVKEMTEVEDGPRLLDMATVAVANRSPLPTGEGRGIIGGLVQHRAKAYELMSCYIGLLDYAKMTGRQDLVEAAVLAANDIMAFEIGLSGSGAAGEFWFDGAKRQADPYARAQETCVTITWMRFCEKLLEMTGDSIYADHFERAFYNAYLAAIHPSGSVFAAYTPVSSGTRAEGHLHCRMHTNCCNANGPRGFVAFLRSQFQTRNDEIFLNWFASSRATVMLEGRADPVVVDVHSLYPVSGKVEIRFRLREPRKFKFSVRIPGTTEGNSMTVCGTQIAANRLVGPGYVSEERVWKDGDALMLELGLPVVAHEVGHHMAFTRGPVLLARDTRFGDGDLSLPLHERSIDRFDLPAFAVENPTDPMMRLVVAAPLPLTTHDESPREGLPRTVRFCDYASAGNLWRPDNAYRTFLPLDYDPIAMVERRRAEMAPRMGVRMDRSKLLIGTYGLAEYARTEQHVKDLRDCGIDFVIGRIQKDGVQDRRTLDLFKKYGLGAIISREVPVWWRGPNGKHVGHQVFSNPLWQYERAADRFRDHPAIWGLQVVDEPNALDFEYGGRIVAFMKERFPKQLPYINLFPNYALPGKQGQDLSATMLGTASYREHIEKYCRHLPLDYICYDHYPWGWRNKLPWMFNNLKIVSDACAGTGKSMWVVLQCNACDEENFKNRSMTENTMRYQAYTAMSFGAELISWACWTKGWWTDNVLDTNGVKTATYDRLRVVNAELHNLGPQFMKYRRSKTDLVGFPSSYSSVGQTIVSESTGAIATSICAEDGAALSVGHFLARDGSGGHALFIVACDDPDDKAGVTHRVRFCVKGQNAIRANGGTGAVPVTRVAPELCVIDIHSNQGVLVEFGRDQN